MLGESERVMNVEPGDPPPTVPSGPTGSVSGETTPFPAAVAYPLVASLIVKVCLLGFNRGEYTDGILQLTLFEHDVPFFPPLYTLCCQLLAVLGMDLLMAGRLVSILASSLLVIPLYSLVRRLSEDPRVAAWAVWLYLAAPMQNRWAIRVMTDGLFSVLFSAALSAFILAYTASDSDARRHALWLWFWGGLACLTRYHALVFPLLFVVLVRNRRDLLSSATDSNGRRPVSWLWSLPASLPWIGLVVWIATRGFGHGGQFASRFSLLGYAVTVEGWLLYLPWAITYPLAILVLMGIIQALRGDDRWRFIAQLTLALCGIWLVVQTAFQSFQFRYWLPLLPLFCILGAYGSRAVTDWVGTASWTKALVPAAVAWGLVMSLAVWGLQRDTWANVTATAMHAAELPADTRIWCDEVYRQGVHNSKVSFWSGREDILPLPTPFEHLQDLSMFRDGDIILYHPGAYTSEDYLDHQKLWQVFAPDFEVERLDLYSSRTYALLPDIMTFPPGSTSQPAALAYRHWPQVHWGIVVRLHAARTP